MMPASPPRSMPRGRAAVPAHRTCQGIALACKSSRKRAADGARLAMDAIGDERQRAPSDLPPDADFFAEKAELPVYGILDEYGDSKSPSITGTYRPEPGRWPGRSPFLPWRRRSADPLVLVDAAIALFKSTTSCSAIVSFLSFS